MAASKKSIFAVLLGLAGYAAISVLLTGFSAAVVYGLGLWSILVLFGLEMLAVVAVLVFFIPPSKTQAFADLVPWLRRLTDDARRKMDTPLWQRVNRYGHFALVFMAMMVGGGLLAAIVIRLLVMKERRAWSYAFVAGLLAVMIKVAVYMGATDVFRSFLAVIPG